MHEKAKELIKQLAAELEFETIPALYHEASLVYDDEAERKIKEYEAAKDIQSELKELYKILKNY